MRLLLNEMWSPAIAEQLRTRGFDVVSACEPMWAGRYRSVEDDVVFARAQSDRRTVVTDNVEDYLPLHLELEARNEAHCGVVYALRPHFDRSQPELVIGRMVQALEAFLRDHLTDDPLGRGHFLRLVAPD